MKASDRLTVVIKLGAGIVLISYGLYIGLLLDRYKLYC